MAAHSQVSSKSENLGKSIQVCFMAQNVGIINFRASSLLSVTTALQVHQSHFYHRLPYHHISHLVGH